MLTELDFRPVRLCDAGRMRHFLEPNSEGSCQHAFVSLISLREKYGDETAEISGSLIIHRARLDRPGIRVYLAPMPEGRYEDAGAAPWQAVLDDAHAHGCKVLFHTLTDNTKHILETYFPERYEFTPRRDLAEYIYETGRIAALSGHHLAKRRAEVRKLRNFYGSRLQTVPVTRADFDDIRLCEQQWLAAHMDVSDFDDLSRESRTVGFHLENWDALGMSGVIARIDGVPVGFSYGAPVNSLYYDALIEKADHRIPGLYRLLFQEEARLSAAGFQYINREEDLGIPGLRQVKLLYKPEILLEKYDAKEK